MDASPFDPSAPAHPASSDFQPARFPVELSLSPADPSLLADARAAVRQELQDRSKWKRLRCRKISVIAERDRGTVYALHVGGSIEFDWTWEGAVAFRPHALPDDGDGPIDMADFEASPVDEASLWSGEVLEVDERNGCLFIRPTDPENPPTVGSFLVRPFDFLGAVDAVYHEPRFASVHDALSRRLAASAGGVHPPVASESSAGLDSLHAWWKHGWSVLWGPPGTGKTHTIGRQIAAVLDDPSERILVVSTTNRATDAVALSIGRAVRLRRAAPTPDSPESNAPPESNDPPDAPVPLDDVDAGRIQRIGQGASFQAFQAEGLEALLSGGEADVLSRIDELARRLPLFDSWDDKALVRRQIADLRAGSSDRSKRAFVDPEVRVAAATVFKALQFLDDQTVRRLLESGAAPFTTIFIDEAGLISRAAAAALSLLAARRVVLVGDSKQLAPISRIARVLPARLEKWLATSGVGHLRQIDDASPGVHVLSEQRRMHPDVCQVVSHYQYEGRLTTAPETAGRTSRLPSLLANGSRAVWYVLDEEGRDLASIRAERGPGNRSWVRRVTPEILEKLFHDPSMRESAGLFISPYKAQVAVASQWFARQGVAGWTASTVHSQQGAEADLVVFDTVNAGSCTWPYEEWKRLVNVGLSRAKEAVILLASRSEMQEPHLRPLVARLSPLVLRRQNGQVRWEPVSPLALPADATPGGRRGELALEPPPENSLGRQIADRKALQPILSHEQQRLSNLDLDGKPRLVRGVAGSGKTVVLSNWLAKTAKRLATSPDARIWAVYANRALHRLLRESIEAAWSGAGNVDEFPWRCVSLMHVKDVLAGLLAGVGLSIDAFEYEYDRAADEYLNRQDEAAVAPRCHALFIDEAQDMGPRTLRLLLSLIEQTNPDDRNSRSAHIFYDNAQNIYARKTPKWSEFGLDLRGRATIMRESFRSTQPIAELAVNLLQRLTAPHEPPDHKELLALGLLESTRRGGRSWLRVRFNQVQGPKPFFRRCANRDQELTTLGDDLLRLIQDEHVAPADICLIYNGKSTVRLLEDRLAPRLARIGVELSVQTGRSFERRPDTLLVTTAHSYKGYDAEVVLIPCVDQYVTQDGRILAANLYVAATRARSILGIYSSPAEGPAGRNLHEALQDCFEALKYVPAVDDAADADDCVPEEDAGTGPSNGRDGGGDAPDGSGGASAAGAAGGTGVDELAEDESDAAKRPGRDASAGGPADDGEVDRRRRP